MTTTQCTTTKAGVPDCIIGTWRERDPRVRSSLIICFHCRKMKDASCTVLISGYFCCNSHTPLQNNIANLGGGGPKEIFFMTFPPRFSFSLSLPSLLSGIAAAEQRSMYTMHQKPPSLFLSLSLSCSLSHCTKCSQKCLVKGKSEM